MATPEWRAAGDRIQVLLDASSTGGPVARDRAEQLVREVVELYGAGLQRILEMSGEPGLIERLASDDLVASLLLVHGLHPHDLHRRVADALERVRPYLGSHGGDVDLLDITDDVVRLRFAGSCRSCPSSAVTLELTVEDAIRAAAPEITSIEVIAAQEDPMPTMIPAETLLRRVHGGAEWHPVPDLAALASGEVGGFLVAGTTVLACRIDDELFAYHDRCGRCDASLAGAALHRLVRAGQRELVLRCPRCRSHFDVKHAGAGVDEGVGPEIHLDPIPLLLREGVLSMAILATPAVL
ncbi:NifU family protein [Mycolicibacterium komossense]|uniref:NifU family protein n=1 Tax=Mycolicibacterium komossense TaxID=1779 RepID=A0ABT3CG80_9MYCO|nr:NifU family protein [Mycolicibacterium komossense]MCV7228512.1 NifU family protein [Mycolicibacterium komossense]